MSDQTLDVDILKTCLRALGHLAKSGGRVVFLPSTGHSQVDELIVAVVENMREREERRESPQRKGPESSSEKSKDT